MCRTRTAHRGFMHRCGARAAASRPMQPALRTNLSWVPCGTAPRRWDAVRAIKVTITLTNLTLTNPDLSLNSNPDPNPNPNQLLANRTLAIIGDSLGLYML